MQMLAVPFTERPFQSRSNPAASSACFSFARRSPSTIHAASISAMAGEIESSATLQPPAKKNPRASGASAYDVLSLRRRRPMPLPLGPPHHDHTAGHQQRAQHPDSADLLIEEGMTDHHGGDESQPDKRVGFAQVKPGEHEEPQYSAQTVQGQPQQHRCIA